jgi:hypothetical protein
MRWRPCALPGIDTDDLGTDREFGARGTSKLRTKRMPRTRLAARDATGIECARLARAFAVILGAATTSLLLHYAARLAAASATKGPGERAAAIAALEQERDSAIAALQASIRQQRKQAIERARAALARPRFRIALPADRQSPLVRSREQVMPVRRPSGPRRARRGPISSGP